MLPCSTYIGTPNKIVIPTKANLGLRDLELDLAIQKVGTEASKIPLHFHIDWLIMTIRKQLNHLSSGRGVIPHWR